jgi:hypothetical protein
MEPAMTKSITRALGFFALLALAGCYNTSNIKNGGLVCGAAGTCPSGFECRSDGQVGLPGHCWKNGTPKDAGTTPSPDTAGPKADADPGAVCTSAPAPGLGPFTDCSANQPIPNSTCDPVCQYGCPCNHRCVLDEQTNTSFICEASAPPVNTTFVQPLGACNGLNTTLCAPGSVCINDSVCQNLCYKACRTDQDCGSKSRCTGTIPIDNQTVENLYFCSPPIELCDPTGIAACGTARTNFKCVFLAGLTGVGNTDSTVCDCSSFHSVAVGQKCTASPDNCAPGSVCVNAICHTVCSLKVSGSACPNGVGCSAIYGSQNYGYCR